MTMASLNKNAIGSDDEDDLESLRLAALKSLKPKTTVEIQSKPLSSHCKPHHSYNKTSTFGAAQTTRHHNRGFRSNSGRIGRNGINSRARLNTNLISIQTIDSDEPKEVVIKDTPKLILPQDRYHRTLELEDTPKESSGNKFDRYDDNSEESDSDSDELMGCERKDSVEFLMNELENEINLLDRKEETQTKEGDSHQTNVPDKDTLIILEADPELVQIDEEVNDKTSLKRSPGYSPPLFSNLEVTSTAPLSPKSKTHFQKRKSRSRSPKRSRSPSRHRKAPFPTNPDVLNPMTTAPLSPRSKSHFQNRKSRSRSPPRKSRYSPPLSINPEIVNPMTTAPLSPRSKSHYQKRKSRSRSPPRKVRYSPRALSPLTLNTEVLNTITMAPLSPRSAAFVLENRQILARRQMSPKRSLSRESSCPRSLTPKRSKLSPRRRSRSPISPRRRSSSPPRRIAMKRSSKSPVASNKQAIHKRLGSRPSSRNVSPYTELSTAKRKRASRSISLSLSPSPDRSYHKRPLNETTGHVNVTEVRNRREKQRKESSGPKTKEDPVLEARRRKFESPVQINNGIIKLKSNKTDEDDEKVETDQLEESPAEDEDEEVQEENDEILDLNPPNLDDLWSDDESDDENEGRFKSKPSSEKKNVTVLPFRKLTEKPIPILPKDNGDRKYKRQRSRRSRSPLIATNKSELKQPVTKTTANKVRTKTIEGEKKKNTVAVKRETNKNTDILKTCQSEKVVKRKVKIQKFPEVAVVGSNVENSEEPEVIVENEDELAANKEDDGGDLRAELSRRRAQRLIKAGSLAEALPARLLKTALQEVVPKRTKLSQGCAGRRVLILRRLSASPTNLEPATKGKLPIHMRLGSNVEDVEEPVRERRPKRPRPNRRKKQVQV